MKLLPLMFGWKQDDLKWQGAFGIYAPSGNFQKGALANVGTTIGPSSRARRRLPEQQIRLRAEAFAGFDFNTKNGTTNYKTGDQFYLDGTLAQHLPLFGGFVGAGANDFSQQITGDSGSGAKLGRLRRHDSGYRPGNLLSYGVGGRMWPPKSSGCRKSAYESAQRRYCGSSWRSAGAQTEDPLHAE